MRKADRRRLRRPPSALRRESVAALGFLDDQAHRVRRWFFKRLEGVAVLRLSAAFRLKRTLLPARAMPLRRPSPLTFTGVPPRFRDSVAFESCWEQQGSSLQIMSFYFVLAAFAALSFSGAAAADEPVAAYTREQLQPLTQFRQQHRRTIDGRLCAAAFVQNRKAFVDCTDAPNPAGESGRPWCYVEPQLLDSGAAWNYCAPGPSLAFTTHCWLVSVFRFLRSCKLRRLPIARQGFVRRPDSRSSCLRLEA